MAKFIRLVAINFAILSSLIVICFILVPLARQLIWQVGQTAGLAASLPNYEQADWAPVHFDEIDDLHTEYRSFVGWRRASYEGRTITVLAPYGERRTPLPEDASGPTVFFFGGSAMWGTGARDQETIPSLYAAATGRRARNFGESGYIAHQSLEMMLWLLRSGERPDVVVFYDGVNDVLQKCEEGHSLFSHGQESAIRSRMSSKLGSLSYFFDPLRRMLPDFEEDATAEARSDCDQNPAKAKAVAEALLDDWGNARALAQSHGIRFYAVLQPVIYFSKTRKDHLQTKLRDPERQEQYEAVYPYIRAGLAARGFADFTAVLDRDEYIYVDFVHLSPNGNAIVAEALAELVD